MGIERTDIVEAARRFLGAPWRHQGRSLKYGIDCVGLPLLVGIELGYMDPELITQANYSRRPTNELIPLFKVYLDVVLPRNEQPGDVVVFADSGYPCHCGILTSDSTVIHAHALDRKVIEQPLNVAVS